MNFYKKQTQGRQIPAFFAAATARLWKHGLEAYDEFALPMLFMGRCAQDDYYLAPMGEEAPPGSIRARFLKRIEDVVPLDGYCLLVFFWNSKVKRCDLRHSFAEHRQFRMSSCFANNHVQDVNFINKFASNLATCFQAYITLPMIYAQIMTSG